MSARSGTRSSFTYQRLVAHLRTPLYRNGYFLTLSSLLTSGIGLLYWVLVAHQYAPYDVGINTAVIASMTFLAGISEINLMSALIRFIPVAGRSTKRLVLYSYLVSLVVAAIISILYIENLGRWSPALEFLGKNRTLGTWFTISTMMWCIFVLQDSVLTGLRRASWVPLENTVFSLTKIVLMLMFAISIPALGIFASWSLALIVAIIPTNYYIFRKLIPFHEKQEDQINGHIEPGQVVRYVVPDYFGAIFWLICTSLMPVIVTTIAGATANAYFYLAWTIANTLYLIGPSMGSSLIVEAVNDPQKLALYSYKIFKNTFKIVVPVATLIAIFAPLILMIFGRGYSSEGTTLLRLLALSAIPNTVNTIFVSVSRVQRRMTAVVLTASALYSIILGLSFIFLKFFGIAGVGAGWLVSQALIATVIYATQLRKFWSTTGEGTMGIKNAAYNSLETATLIHFAYKVAVKLNLIRLLSFVKSSWSLRERRERLKALLPDIARALPDSTVKGNWTVQTLVNNATNCTIAFYGPPGMRGPVVLKLPGNGKEAESLNRQWKNLRMLAGEERLGEWRRLLPEMITSGQVDGQVFFAERALPGETMLQVIRSQGIDPCIIRLAAAGIEPLHQKTARPIVVGVDMLEAWVNEPVNKLSHYLNNSASSNQYQPAIDALQTELNVSLSGHQIGASWVHGDYSPANILTRPDGNEITGIVDWDLARPNGIALLDLMHLLLSIRMEVEHKELGQIVRDLLVQEGWRRDEIELIRSAEHDLPGKPLDLRVILLLSWLHHIHANLSKTTRYDRSGFWSGENILQVLKVLGPTETGTQTMVSEA